MMKYFQQNKFVKIFVIILVAFMLLVYYPAIRLNFMLIDDGQIIKNSKALLNLTSSDYLQSIKNILFEVENGRVRPVYWLTQAIVSSLSFYNASAMHVFRIIFLVTSCYLLYAILKKMVIDIRWILFSIFLFVINFQNLENFYRLGPTEVYLGIFYLLILYMFLKNSVKRTDYILVTLFSLLGSFTKETFFLVSLPLLIFLLPSKILDFRKKRGLIVYTLLLNLFFGLSVFVIRQTYGAGMGYAQKYQFDITAILANLKNYFNQINHYQHPLLLILICYLIYWLFVNWKNIFKLNKKLTILFMFFLTESILNLVVLLPWPYVLGRYLVLVNISLIFAFAIVLQDSWEHFLDRFTVKQKYQTHCKTLILLALMPFIFIRNIFPIANYQSWQEMDSNLTTDLLGSLSKNIPQNENVYVNYVTGDANIEIYLETKWHLEEFYKRPDVTFTYLDRDNLCVIGTRYILDRTSERLIPKDKLLRNNLEVVDSGSYTYSPLNYGEVARSFFNLTKSKLWSNAYEFDWTIYRQKPETCLTEKFSI